MRLDLGDVCLDGAFTVERRHLQKVDIQVGCEAWVTGQPTGGAHRFFVYGRPYNNLLITALKAFGLTEEDYRMSPDQDGFGGYKGGHGAEHYTQYVSTSGARNAVLPGLWTAG